MKVIKEVLERDRERKREKLSEEVCVFLKERKREGGRERESSSCCRVGENRSRKCRQHMLRTSDVEDFIFYFCVLLS